MSLLFVYNKPRKTETNPAQTPRKIMLSLSPFSSSCSSSKIIICHSRAAGQPFLFSFSSFALSIVRLCQRGSLSFLPLFSFSNPIVRVQKSEYIRVVFPFLSLFSSLFLSLCQITFKKYTEKSHFSDLIASIFLTFLFYQLLLALSFFLFSLSIMRVALCLSLT